VIAARPKGHYLMPSRAQSDEFSYQELPAELRQIVREGAEQIHYVREKATVETGRRLTKVKALLEHGQFLRTRSGESRLRGRCRLADYNREGIK
jgi:hypothetical protein